MSANAQIILILTVGFPMAVFVGVTLGRLLGDGLHDIASDVMRLEEGAGEHWFRNEEIALWVML